MPLQGTVEHWSVRARDGQHEDLAWSYGTPLRETREPGLLEAASRLRGARPSSAADLSEMVGG